MPTEQLRLFDYTLTENQSTFSKICSYLEIDLNKDVPWPDKFGYSLKEWANKSISEPIITLSLFSGAGGLDLGFKDVGFNIVEAVEIDDNAVQTLNANNTDNTLIHKTDIREYNADNLDKVDFIIGGPPCQTFSAAGRRAEGVTGTSDQRGTLFEEYVRLLKKLKPRGFLFENVYGLTGANKGEAWKQISTAFESAGYRLFYRILDSADYGVPQFRERLIIVGLKKGEYFFPRPTHGPDSIGNQPYYTASEALKNCIVPEPDLNRQVNGRYGDLLKEIPPGLNYSYFTEKMGHPNPVFAWRSKFSDFLYKADPEMPVRTIKAQGGKYTGPFHWDNRPFSISELKRLQTFPDNYQLVGSRVNCVKQIGNSVPPQLSRVLAMTILNQVFNIQLPFQLPLLGHNEELGFRKRKRELTKVYSQKAQKYISMIKVPKKIYSINERHYYASLEKNFDWLEVEKPNIFSKFHVTVAPSENGLKFFVGETNNNYDFKIIIEPITDDNIWESQFNKRVILYGEKLEESYYTAVWKAFENELIKHNIKADLVQLCGYYQYSPSFKATMKIMSINIDKKWKVVQKVVSGEGTRAILSEEELSRIWEVHQNEVLPIAKFLRALGYEIRNHNTNTTIPNGHYLIPYAFPTLTPLSVQLKKSLG